MRFGSYLTVGFLVSLLALLVFAFLANGIGQEGGQTRLDRDVTESLETHGQEHPEILRAFGMLTHLGGPEVLLLGGLLVAFALVTGRHNRLALVWMVAIVGAAVLNEVLKLTFQRQRPTLAVHSWSFPSGHAMNSLVFYGLLAYLLILRFRSTWQRVIVVAVLGLLVLAIGFSRIYLGVHWLTDVVAGFAVAAIWLSFCISAIETVRRRRARAAVVNS